MSFAKIIQQNPIYGLTDSVEFAQQLIDAGIKIIQYRDKETDDEEFIKKAKKIKKLCQNQGVSLIINDRYHLIGQSGADGVHVGLEDIKKVIDKYLLEENFYTAICGDYQK